MHVNTNMEYEKPGKSYLHSAGINVGVTNANRTSTIIMEGRHFHENTTFKNLGALLQKTMTATLLWIMKVTYLSVDFSDQNCLATVQCYTNIIDLHFPYLPPYLISRHIGLLVRPLTLNQSGSHPPPSPPTYPGHLSCSLIWFCFVFIFLFFFLVFLFLFLYHFVNRKNIKLT